ncbi:unnamed protein product, partial [Iphiclides podalirius]
MKAVIVLLISCACFVDCIPPPHPAVVAVRQEEELLPVHLRSPALHNPHLQELLQLTSVLHSGEKPVYQREADLVSRREIYNILTHAGLVHRQPGLPPPTCSFVGLHYIADDSKHWSERATQQLLLFQQ